MWRVSLLHVWLVCVLDVMFVADGQMVGPYPTSSTSALQQCVANLACSIDYSTIFQAKLDNATHYLEMELDLLRHQTNAALTPLDGAIKELQNNHTRDVGVLTQGLARAETTLSLDRDVLANLTRSVYVLNDEFHRENMNRYQDVHQLTMDMNAAQNSINTLTALVNALLSQSGNGTAAIQMLANSTSGVLGASSCAATDVELQNVKANLTYYINAYTSSQKTLENVRALESFLQSQVVELKANLTQAEKVNEIKDHLIVNLQTQLKSAQATSPTLPPPGTCNSELGMRSGAIPPSAVTASASQAGYEPTHARLGDGQGWYTPERTSSQDFLQIDTGALHYITTVATQGAPCCDVMVTNYTLQYSTDGVTWHDYKKDCQQQYLVGNADDKTVVTHVLDTPLIARYVRFNVVDFKKNGVSNYVGMRVELYGCTK